VVNLERLRLIISKDQCIILSAPHSPIVPGAPGMHVSPESPFVKDLVSRLRNANPARYGQPDGSLTSAFQVWCMHIYNTSMTASQITLTSISATLYSRYQTRALEHNSSALLCKPYLVHAVMGRKKNDQLCRCMLILVCHMSCWLWSRL
jgi:hypothetical protein